ncbi:Fur family transcriptional regulator, ferric uptake regulator/Fur family transcriptional regulator, peroxide stress response regulator [Persephonella hydrogeniphila]|uniref:Fur family transcriptional regulator, ferric uptake regulator/Fur family transcriptional regulator, peroxide stress response regulator n=1 Tax=Persephonella hydrogeniphila TaxID=198703 RepID=A0A285NJU7_9AQUI|nr:transcriptional repressor [Persephonella hydrogeniphila]SNZ09213.1 Fur family transcriptional regulator, ferric uptake regulator/Fur family transcriptional regulator, peroxide stress response regulator [Persephonella hydrogeniphila]
MEGNIKRRNTQQRKVILDILRSTDIHPTADWIYERARQVIPNISLGTVYRNLKILKDEGLILELNDGKQSRFDGRIDEHFHFKCTSCNSIYDIDRQEIVQIDKERLGKEGYTVQGYEVVFTGICPKCNGNQN